MAYSGSTAATSLVNVPRCMVPAMSAVPNTTGLTTGSHHQSQQGGQLWFYSSTNKTTDLFVANFFSDGKALGMKPGDVVFANSFTSAGSSVVSMIGSVTGVTTSGATLAAGSKISSTYT